MSDEAKKNFEKVITVIGEILEGGASRHNRLLFKEGLSAGQKNLPCYPFI